MYPKEEKERILADFYESGMTVAAFCRRAGSPSRRTLDTWIETEKQGLLNVVRRPIKGSAHGKAKYKHYSKETKHEAIKLVRAGGRPGDVARRLGIAHSNTVREWIKKADEARLSPGKGVAHMGETAQAKIARLERELKEARAQQDIFRVMMSDPKAGDPENLSNSGKAELGEKLRKDFGWCLSEVLTSLRISKSSYEYAKCANEKRKIRQDKVENLVTTSFCASGKTYGYRRIWAHLKSEITFQGKRSVSQREVRHAMHALGLIAKRPRPRRPWNSYKGETDTRPANLPRIHANTRRSLGEDFRGEHDFSAHTPGILALTDVTEFSIPAGKIYLSPVIDCFDGKPAAWTISEHPDSRLVDSSLTAYLTSLPKGTTPIVHTDGGVLYRSASWKKRCSQAGVIRSMSRKGCCKDNARIEGFFGTLKSEFFYSRSWTGCTLKSFIKRLDAYLRWYVTGRLKAFRENGVTIYETIARHRQRLGYEV